jgi:hypothetical protein
MACLNLFRVVDRTQPSLTCCRCPYVAQKMGSQKSERAQKKSEHMQEAVFAPKTKDTHESQEPAKTIEQKPGSLVTNFGHVHSYFRRHREDDRTVVWLKRRCLLYLHRCPLACLSDALKIVQRHMERGTAVWWRWLLCRGCERGAWGFSAPRFYVLVLRLEFGGEAFLSVLWRLCVPTTTTTTTTTKGVEVGRSSLSCAQGRQAGPVRDTKRRGGSSTLN